MTNNSASTIRTAILAHLAAVTQLKQVVLGRQSDISGGFPFARVYLVGMDDKLEDQQANFRTYRFAIDIIQENTNKSKTNAEADLEDAIDAVMDKLNAKWNLPDGGTVPTVDFSQIDPSPIREVEMDVGPCLLCTIFLSARTLIY